MRKVVMFNMISVDGYFEGEDKWDLEWHKVDDEFNQFAIEQLDDAGGLIFGRITYEGMFSYWSSAAALESDPQVAGRMNKIPKFIFSKSMQEVRWNNSQLMNGNAITDLSNLKQQAGKDLFIFGSAQLISTFMEGDMIDEYRLMLNPVILGRGSRLFKGNHSRQNLSLINNRNFKNGNVLLTYSKAGI